MPYSKSFVITATGITNQQLPADFNPSDNLIHCIGSGGNGSAKQSNSLGGRGGGGGAYASTDNVNLGSGGQTIEVCVGAGGGTQTTYVKNVAGTVWVRADYGRNGTTAAVGAGGLVNNSTGVTRNAGGDGGNNSSAGGGGGGGAAGPNAAGGTATTSGGTADGTQAGGAVGSAGTTKQIWSTYGPGSGGGGGASGNNIGAAGGSWGGGAGGNGGGSGGSPGTSAGAQGLIVIEYNPVPVSATAGQTIPNFTQSATGSVVPNNPLISTLVENFDGSFPPTTLTNYSSANATQTQSAGRLEQNFTSVVADTTVYVDQTSTAYSLVGSALYARLTQTLQGVGSVTGGTYQSTLRIHDSNNGGNYLFWRWTNDGHLVAVHGIGYANTTDIDLIYSASTHAWLRIKESGGTVYFDTAPDTASNPPIETDWVNRASVTVATLTWTPNAIWISMRTDMVGSPSAIPTGPAKWDGLNTSATVDSAPSALTATQTVPVFGQTATAAETAQADASSQAVPVFGQTATVATASYPAISTLVQNFDGTYPPANMDPFVDATGTQTQANGTLQQNFTATTPTAEVNVRAYPYSLTGSSIFAKLVPLQGVDGVTGGSYQCSIRIDDYVNGGQNSLRWRWTSDGNLICAYVTAWSETVLATLTYALADHAWLRIRESGGTVYWDTAPTSSNNPPIEGDWTNRGSALLTTIGWDVGAIYAYLRSAVIATPSALPSGPANWDGLNTSATAISDIYATASQTVPAFGQTATGVVVPTDTSATATQTVPAFSQIATGYTGSEGCALAVNFGSATTYGGFPFANLCHTMGRWALQSGTATFTQDGGELNVSAVTGTATFMAYLCDNGINLPQGTFTLKNPNGHTLGVGSYQDTVNPKFLAYGTGTQRTFDWPNGYSTTNGMFLMLQVTATGIYKDMAVIMPNHLASYDGGDVFAADFISFHQSLGIKAFRPMDWTDTNYNIDTVWADRTLPTKTSWRGAGCIYPQVPWEIVIALANKLGIEPVINVPPRATQAYVDSLAALFQANLNAGLKVWVEGVGNEIWNTAGAFAANYGWIGLYNHTKNTAAVNSTTSVLTKTAHGLSNNDLVNCFTARSSRAAGLNDMAGYTPYWYDVCVGKNLYAEVLDANTFRLWSATGPAGTMVTFPAACSEVLFVRQAELVDYDVDAHYGTVALRNWTSFDTAMGAARVKAVLGSQASSSSVTSARLAPTGVTARTDAVAIAPYFYGYWLGGAIDVASGQFTPKAWSNAGSVYHSSEQMTVHCGVYADGSNPSDAQVAGGTGTGFVGHVTFTQGYTGNTYTSGSAITGLVNGTIYKVVMLFVDPKGYTWRIENNVTASATTSTVDFLDTYDNFSKRHLIDLDGSGHAYQWVQAHKDVVAASSKPSIQMIAYEGGMHLDESAPPAIKSWAFSYVEDTAFGNMLKHYVNALSALGLVLYAHFGDAGDDPDPTLSWRIANSYSDTTDARYVALASYGGWVPKRTLVDSGTVTAAQIRTQPASFPYTVYTFADATWTYSILKGNGDRNYSISGNVLSMDNDTGIDWGTPGTRNVTVLATDTYTDAVFTVQVPIGAAWYELDALYAWDSTTDSDNTAVNPTLGGALSLSSGTAATITGGYWDTINGPYSSSNGLTGSIDATKPFVIAFVIDSDDVSLTANYTAIGIRAGVDPFIGQSYLNGNLRWRWYASGLGWDDQYVAAAFPAAGTPHVWWFYADPVAKLVYFGTDDTTTNPGGTQLHSGAWPASIDTYVGYLASLEKKGSIQIVNRAGMTLADAKQIAANTLAVHTGAASSTSATASQTVPVFGQTVTLATILQATASQTVPVFGQTATLTGSTSATATQTVPAFGQTATVTELASATATQTVPAFGQTATAAELASATASQTVSAFGQTATATETIAATADQAIPAFTQSFYSGSSTISADATQTVPVFQQSFAGGTAPSAVVGTQTVPAFGQAATGAEIAKAASAQTTPAFGQTATATELTSVTATQTTPAFGQSATVTESVAVTAAQTMLPFPQTFTSGNASSSLTATQAGVAFTQDATAAGVASVTAAQTVPVFGSTATETSYVQASADQTMLAFPSTMTGLAPAHLVATQTVPAFDQIATVERIAKATATQTVPNFIQSFYSGLAEAHLEALQTVPDFGQTATAREFGKATAAQTVPVFDQTADALTLISLAASQQVPVFGSTATGDSWVESSAAQDVPAFQNAASVGLWAVFDLAAQAIPVFGMDCAMLVFDEPPGTAAHLVEVYPVSHVVGVEPANHVVGVEPANNVVQVT